MQIIVSFVFFHNQSMALVIAEQLQKQAWS